MKTLKKLPALLLAAATLAACSCSSLAGIPPETRVVRTTAYTHTEADHRRFGCQTCIGTTLKHGSAAADWSRYPLGTVFTIEGDATRYRVEDYGSALVGTGTIDIYQPSRAAMNRWGVRVVRIHIIQWGSLSESATILKARTRYAPIRRMLADIPEKYHGRG